MMNKLIIGTANFGLRYGIANDKKLGLEEAFDILDCAHSLGIEWIDTARAYGDAENVMGEFFAKRGKTFRIISKLPGKDYKSAREVEDEVYRSLKAMQVPFIDVLLLHSFDTWKQYAHVILPVFQSLCRDKIAGNYGVSVYHPEEVAEIARGADDKMVFEFPLNLFDQRILKSGLMQDLGSRGHLLFARSIFLQGLFFLGDDALQGRFGPVKNKVKEIGELAAAHNVRPECIALLFAASKAWVDGVVVGVDNTEHLKKNIECLGTLNYGKYAALERSLAGLAVDDEDIILPYRWNA